jgi:hypothetical protein
MIEQKAIHFADAWIAAWNSQDLDNIMEHYSDDVEFSSPFIVKLSGESSGNLRSKQDLRLYFQKGLEAYPDLHFELLSVLIGVDSIVLHYRSVNNLMAAEVMYFDKNGKVSRVSAHYAS